MSVTSTCNGGSKDKRVMADGSHKHYGCVVLILISINFVGWISIYLFIVRKRVAIHVFTKCSFSCCPSPVSIRMNSVLKECLRIRMGEGSFALLEWFKKIYFHIRYHYGLKNLHLYSHILRTSKNAIVSQGRQLNTLHTSKIIHIKSF